MIRAISRVLNELLSERGDISTMRIMSLWCMLIASIIALYGVFYCRDGRLIIELTALFLGAGVAGKVTHKFAESKEGPKDEKLK
jgi:hypothetical protein